MKIINYSLKFLSLYYTYILNINNDFFVSIDLIKWTQFFLLFDNKFIKPKYTLKNFEEQTIITMSTGILIKYYNNPRKSTRKSLKSTLLLMRFIFNTIRKLIRKKPYVFIVRGLSKKLLKLINFFSSLKNSNMVYYLLEPVQQNNRYIFKKIRSIKRKFQHKNMVRVKRIWKDLRSYKLNHYRI